MPGPLFHFGATANCPHAGRITTITTNTRVLVGGKPAATMGDTFPIAACTFTVGPKAQPCVKVQWLSPAARVLVNGQPAILQTSNGACQSAEQAPQGPPIVVTNQPRVIGT